MKIALIAHDNKKSDMVSFVMKRLAFFKKDKVELVATGTTGNLIDLELKELQVVLMAEMLKLLQWLQKEK